MVKAQKKSRLAIGSSIALFLFVVLLGSWYEVAANYDYAALAGRYVLNRGVEECTLDLRSDHTFVQELVQAGSVQRAQGTWHRYGQSHVSFSKEFLAISGQQLNAAGEAHGEFDKRLGILPYLTLAPLPDGPRFRKQFVR